MSKGRLTEYPWDALRDVLDWWLPRCSLSDWQVELRIERSEAFDDKESCGELHSWRTHFKAHILLLDPKSYQADGTEWGDYDMLETLAHEVAHLVLWPWLLPQSKTAEYTQYEQAVERVARLLQQLYSMHWPLGRGEPE
jgi:hypothetical protein